MQTIKSIIHAARNKCLKQHLVVLIRTRIPILRWLVHKDGEDLEVHLFRYKKGKICWSIGFKIKEIYPVSGEYISSTDKIICERLDTYKENSNCNYHK